MSCCLDDPICGGFDFLFCAGRTYVLQGFYTVMGKGLSA